MSGTKEGGKKAAAKNLASDPDYYRKIGAKGGRNSPSTFITVPGLASRAGVKGGRISRKPKRT